MLAIHNKIQENAQILMQNIFINPFLEILLSANIKMRTSLYIKHVKDNIRLHPMLLHWQSVHILPLEVQKHKYTISSNINI